MLLYEIQTLFEKLEPGLVLFFGKIALVELRNERIKSKRVGIGGLSKITGQWQLRMSDSKYGQGG